jgi:hypothetical protein
MLTAALAGYGSAPSDTCPHYASSPLGMAWHVGRWMQTTGRTQPHEVRMSRGYSVAINGLLVDASNLNAITRLK